MATQLKETSNSKSNNQGDSQSNNQNNGQLMGLGDFVFEISTLVYQTFERQNSWRHPGNEPVGADPTFQYTGPGTETVSFSGVIYKELSNPKALDTLREMASTGQAYVLVSGSGYIFGFYVIGDITESQSYFDRSGDARRVEFSVKLIKKPVAQ